MASPNDVFGLCALILLPVQVILVSRPNGRRWLLDCMGAAQYHIAEEPRLLRHVLFFDSVVCFLILFIHVILMLQFGPPDSISKGVLYTTQGVLMQIILTVFSMFAIRGAHIPPRPPSLEERMRDEMLFSIRRVLNSILSRAPIPTVEERVPRMVDEEESPKEECAVCFEETIVDLMPRYDCRCSKKLICENCLFTHLQSNGYHCPWCRQSITQVYTRVWGEPAEVDADAGGDAGGDADARGLESV